MLQYNKFLLLIEFIKYISSIIDTAKQTVAGTSHVLFDNFTYTAMNNYIIIKNDGNTVIDYECRTFFHERMFHFSGKWYLHLNENYTKKLILGVEYEPEFLHIDDSTSTVIENEEDFDELCFTSSLLHENKDVVSVVLGNMIREVPGLHSGEIRIFERFFDFDYNTLHRLLEEFKQCTTE